MTTKTTKPKKEKSIYNNHFIIPYNGNKRREIKNILDYYKEDEKEPYKYIIEPFAGTSCFIYHHWLKNKDKPYKYIINDLDKNLIELYELMRPCNKEKLDELIKKCDEHLKTIDKEKYTKLYKSKTLEGFLFCSKIYSIRTGLFPTTKKITVESFNYIYNCPIYDFFKNNDHNIIITCKNGIDVIKEFNNKESFIFIDPPYILSENGFYKHDKVNNIYEYLCNNKIESMKSKILCCLNDNWIIKLLFKDQIKNTYNKFYDCSKEIVSHNIITNF